MYRITEYDKEKVRLKAINGARIYSKYLLNKKFAIVTDDLNVVTVTFHKKDFAHLTGLLVNVGENKFFDLCIEGKISRSNIKNLQKHNLSTLFTKATNVENILHFIYADASTNLFLTDFVMASKPDKPFPCAIKNLSKNMVLAFSNGKDILKAKSLRKGTNNEVYNNSKKIIGIFKLYGALWNECVYIQNRNKIVNNIDSSIMSDKLKKYLNI